jgi:hypothetical protein
MTRLFVVTGAPGSGKSTVVPELVRLSPGNLVVMDMDELLDDHGRLLGIDIASPTAAPIRPAEAAGRARLAGLADRRGARGRGRDPQTRTAIRPRRRLTGALRPKHPGMDQRRTPGQDPRPLGPPAKLTTFPAY